MNEWRDYMNYLKEVLGVRALMQPPLVEADEILRYRTATTHYPSQKNQDLIVLHQGAGLFEGEDGELWKKMKLAMKLEERSVLEMEFDFSLNEMDLQKLLEIYRASVVLILSPMPQRQEKRTLGNTIVFETYSPQVLRENADLKKPAWADLQVVMKSLNSN